MSLMQQLIKLIRVLACVLALMPIATAGAATTAVGVPAFPAALTSCTASECADTLHAEHELTFISRLSFPTGTALLTKDAKNELLRVLVELESFARIKHVEVVGHADPSGSARHNRWLSEIRAKRVRDYLAQNGVDTRKVTLRGAGANEPLVGAIDSAEHRRIEMRITLQPFL